MTLEHGFYEIRPYLFGVAGIWALSQSQSNIFTVSGLLFMSAAALILYFRMNNRSNPNNLKRNVNTRSRNFSQQNDEFALYRKSNNRRFK